MKKTTAVLLLNTGTPAQPDAKSVERFLTEFLSDRNIVDLPAWLWQPLLKGIILPRRSPKSAQKYRQIWQTNGSPLLLTTMELALGLQQELKHAGGNSIPVLYAMRYGEPSIQSQLLILQKKGIKNCIIFPLFPQSSFTTTGSIHKLIEQIRCSFPITSVNGYANHPAYTQALAMHLREYWQSTPRAERLIFSFHGIPARLISRGDSYLQECYQTINKLVEILALPAGCWEISFQSRFGPGKWLQPATSERIRSAALEGLSSLQVFAPGFAVDCLETLHEVEIEMRELYQQNGGKSFDYIPALNSSSGHILALATILKEYGI